MRDLARARAFYGQTLGLAEAEADGETGVAVFRAAGSTLVVYVSEHAGTNKATSVTWGYGGDLSALVAELKARGVVFEHYDDLGGLKRDGDIHRAGDFQAIWFKDPDGNILHVNSM